MPDLIHANKNGTFFHAPLLPGTVPDFSIQQKEFTHIVPRSGELHNMVWIGEKELHAGVEPARAGFELKWTPQIFVHAFIISHRNDSCKQKSRSGERLFRWNYSDTSDPRCAHKGIKRLRILYHACLIHANRKAAGLPETDGFSAKGFQNQRLRDDSEKVMN